MAAGVRVCVYLLPLLLVAHAVDLICPFGKILNKCNRNCTEHCGGGATCPEGCTINQQPCDTCRAGCFCPRDLLRFGDICLPEDVCPAVDPSSIEPQDKCSQYDSCNECISSDPDCQWCPYTPDDISFIGSRCRLRDGNPVCPVPMVDPRPTIKNITDEEFSEDVQVRPQKLRLELRAGEPKEFTLQFRPAENFPLDVYFLLDVTGSFSEAFRDTVAPLATNLVSAIQNISERYAIAFGGFGDKRAIPFALPSDNNRTYYRTVDGVDVCSSNDLDLPDCNPTISFRHTTNFSRLDTDELADVLENISIHLNVDSLEGGMDGLVQVLACPEVVGWRDQSLRMLLYMSNALFHLAGDGKVGAAFRPNLGQCALSPNTENGATFDEYTEDTIYDYPSVYQLRDMVRSTETNVIFAVTQTVIDTYQNLTDEIEPFGRVTELQENSSNIISVIEEAYNDISQEVRLTPREFYPNLEFQFTPGEGCGSDPEVCTGVSIANTVSFNVTVTMTSCLEETTTAFLQSLAFGAVELEIVPLCNCDCNNNVTENADECSDIGDLVCGQCQCPTGMSGEMCECPGDTTPPCGTGLGGLECSGPSRGRCDCGQCMCFVQVELLETLNFTEPYFGEHCECDHLTSCGGNLTEDGQLCFGHGECLCTECMCTDIEETTGLPYDGELCECDPIICYNTDLGEVCPYTGSLSDLGNAECDACTGCLCRTGTIRGPEGTCVSAPDLCQDIEECARCVKKLQSDDTDCQELINQGCNATLYTGNTDPGGEPCIFVDEDGCSHTFYVQANDILVEDDRDCPTTGSEGIGNLVWIIPVAVIVGLLILGGIILLIVLLIVCINDRLEYSRFKQDLEDANWDQLENPMYVSPSTQYSNITYRPKKAAAQATTE